MITTALLAGTLAFGGAEAVSPASPLHAVRADACPAPTYSPAHGNASGGIVLVWVKRAVQCMVYAAPVIRSCKAEGWRSRLCRSQVNKLARKCARSIPGIGDIMMVVDCYIENRGQLGGTIMCIIGEVIGLDALDGLFPGRKL